MWVGDRHLDDGLEVGEFGQVGVRQGARPRPLGSDAQLQ